MQKVNLDSSEKEVLLSIGEASEYLGISIDTLRRWEKKDKIIALRSPGGHRYFKQKDLDNLFGRKYEREKEEKQRIIKKKKKISEQKLKHKKLIKIPDREPRIVNIPPTTPVRIISQEVQSTMTYTTSPPPQTLVAPPLQKSVLTPSSINKEAQSTPISSVPPATPAKQELVKKKSNAWIYLVAGLALLIIGFTVFVIFRSPSEVISPVP